MNGLMFFNLSNLKTININDISAYILHVITPLFIIPLHVELAGYSINDESKGSLQNAPPGPIVELM